MTPYEATTRRICHMLKHEKVVQAVIDCIKVFEVGESSNE